jgi:uncharacterized protein (DUF1015 family)
MADIRPFKGIRYNKEKITSFENVITQPYDKIGSELQDDYYKRSPYNFVRIILGKDETEGKEEKYKKAAGYIESWLKENIFLKDEKDALYPYTQEYEANGVKKLRVSFITLLKLSDYEDGIVIPHEKTLSGPKVDRKKLLETTKANTELVFLLFQDEKNAIKDIMSKVLESTALITMKDDEGTIHRVYKMDDDASIKKVQKLLDDKKVFIADGHHRYETSLAHAKESPNNEGMQYILCSLVNMSDADGLTIFPTHRIVKNIEGFDKQKLLEGIKKSFDVKKYDDLEKLNAGLLPLENSFGLCFKSEYYLITLKSKDIALKMYGNEFSDSYKMLDVAILHKLILEDLLGIDKEKLEEKTNLDYVRGYKAAYEKLQKDSYQCAFLLNPTKIEEMADVAQAGDKMPQKSTDFFPKLLSGFVLRQF